LNFGCVPSKALLRSAHCMWEIKQASSFGITVGDVQVDFAAIMQRLRLLRSEISVDDSAAKVKSLGVDLFLGRARFTGKDTLLVDGKELQFKKCVIATGGRAAIPEIPGIHNIKYLTNESIFSLTVLPKRLCVIGAGAIGCELAQAFALFGSQVTILMRSEMIMIREDVEAAAIVTKEMVRCGVKIIGNATYKSIQEVNGRKTLNCTSNGQTLAIEFDEILIAVGRVPNVEDLCLEVAGVQFDTRKGVFVDDQLCTTNKNIFAVGDVCTKYKFTHVSDFMARLVIRNALFFGNGKFSSLVIPWCTYTIPEVAHVGLYEGDLEARGIKFHTFKRNFKDVNRAVLDGETNGFVKIIVKDGTDLIVGATIVAHNAGDMISEITVAINGKIGLGAIANTIHPYPTQAEAIRQCGDAFNRTRLTPFVKILFRQLMNARR